MAIFLLLLSLVWGFFIYRNVRDEETDGLFWFDLGWWNVSKSEWPRLFWLIIWLQIIPSVALFLSSVWLFLRG